jgi:hypothetical protein
MTLKNLTMHSLRVLALIGCALPLTAQIKTCAAQPPGIKSFVIEHAVDVTAILSTNTPNLPDAVAAQIFSGSKEVRSRIEYDSGSNLLINHLFLVNPGAAIPTAASTNFLAIRFSYLAVAVDKVYTSCTPRPAVSVAGTIVDGYPIFGNPQGAPYYFSFGYTTDPTPVIRDVVSDSVGLGLLYAAKAPGTLVFPTIAAVVKGGPTITTKATAIVLDGSLSTGGSLNYAEVGGDLTYQWTTASWGLGIITPNQNQTLVLIGGGPGQYVVNLTVRNALGETATTPVTIIYQP